MVEPLVGDSEEARQGLEALPLRRRAHVLAVEATDATRRRLLALGLVPGSLVEPVRASPAGDPRAYRVRGSLVALRRSDAASVRVLPEPTDS